MIHYTEFITDYFNPKYSNRIRRHNKNIDIISCLSCDNDLPYVDFDKKLSSFCKKCKKQDYMTNPTKIVAKIVDDMVSIKKKESFNGLTKSELRRKYSELVISLLENQKGKCAYSSEYLSMERGLKMSFIPEKIDPSKNYLHKNNTVLVGKMFKTDKVAWYWNWKTYS